MHRGCFKLCYNAVKPPFIFQKIIISILSSDLDEALSSSEKSKKTTLNITKFRLVSLLYRINKRNLKHLN